MPLELNIIYTYVVVPCKTMHIAESRVFDLNGWKVVELWVLFEDDVPNLGGDMNYINLCNFDSHLNFIIVVSKKKTSMQVTMT